MPNFSIIRKTQLGNSFRVASIKGTYDLQQEEITETFTGDLCLPEKWQVGLIVGASGTGKTTIAKELFPQAYVTNFEYTANSIVDDMPAGVSVTDITKMFCSVGFASVPSWLKPYAVLSNGEKMRVDLARALLEPQKLIVFDEFTSVVDRDVAQIGSFSVQKAVRKTDKQFIAVTCHYDVEPWLMPDWVFDTNSMTFRICEEQKKNRPDCRLDIYETKQKEYYWNIFRKHHYLSHSFNKAARVFVAAINGKLCAFTSVLPFAHPKLKNHWRGHRTVVLPEFQGLNISLYLTMFVCELLKKEGKGYITTTSNPARIFVLKKSDKFLCTSLSRNSSGSGLIQNKNKKNSTSSSRITASFRYIG